MAAGSANFINDSIGNSGSDVPASYWDYPAIAVGNALGLSSQQVQALSQAISSAMGVGGPEESGVPFISDMQQLGGVKPPFMTPLVRIGFEYINIGTSSYQYYLVLGWPPEILAGRDVEPALWPEGRNRPRGTRRKLIRCLVAQARMRSPPIVFPSI